MSGFPLEHGRNTLQKKHHFRRHSIPPAGDRGVSDPVASRPLLRLRQVTICDRQGTLRRILTAAPAPPQRRISHHACCMKHRVVIHFFEFLLEVCSRRTPEMIVEPTLTVSQSLLHLMFAPQPVNLVTKTFERPRWKHMPIDEPAERLLHNLPLVIMAPQAEDEAVPIRLPQAIGGLITRSRIWRVAGRP
jgi:hypothetical protein